MFSQSSPEGMVAFCFALFVMLCVMQVLKGIQSLSIEPELGALEIKSQMQDHYPIQYLVSGEREESSGGRDRGWVVGVRLAKGGFLLSEWAMVESEKDPLAVEKSTT